MGKTLDQDILNAFTGKPINMEHLAKCARRNRQVKHGDACDEFIVYSCLFLYDKDLRERFGVTDKLKDLWERRGTEFNVYLYIADGKLSSCSIFKYTESGGARPNITTPKCTQQELRIARRILEFITV